MSWKNFKPTIIGHSDCQSKARGIFVISAGDPLLRNLHVAPSVLDGKTGSAFGVVTSISCSQIWLLNNTSVTLCCDILTKMIFSGN